MRRKPKCRRQTDMVIPVYPPNFVAGGINICLFPVTRPTLRFSADPKAFYVVFVVGVLLYTF